jgi:hypothetical protein
VNLKEWAREQGVSYSAALRWCKSGKLPVPAYQAERLIVIGELPPLLPASPPCMPACHRPTKPVISIGRWRG